MSDTMRVWREHWDAHAEAFAQPLRADGLVSRFVTNPNVTGAYAEAWVRLTARSMLAHRFRISTGAVVRPSDGVRGLRDVPQCDLIIWDPSELPGLFEYGEFALVPFAATRAIIEIKRTVPVKYDLLQQLRERRKLVPEGNLLGVVISDQTPLFDRECRPDWLAADDAEPAMTRLLDGDNRPDTDGVMAFVYFLAQIAGHNRVAL